MELRFLADPETGLPHTYEHGVTEEEARQVLARPGEDAPGRRESRIALGQTWAGRYLQVVYVKDQTPGSVFVVTAYEIRGKALQAYRRRQRRRRQR
jgi:hypothetical protein